MTKDLRGYPSAYDCADQLPALAAWMDEEAMKALPIWQGRRFERGHEYFDLDNPDRGAFVATGDEGPPTDWTYVCRDQVPEQIWAQLVTWGEGISSRQFDAIRATAQDFGVGREQSAAGPARPLPPT